MTDIVKGLFGVSPEELTQQRDAELNTQASAYARLTPQQRATEMLYRGGNQLAGAVGGMMGAQDPQMKKSADLQGILQNGDYNTFEGATAMAKQAAAMGYGNEAQQMYAHAQGLEKSSAELAYKKAQTAKELREADPKMKIAVAALPNNTAASIQAYMASGNISDLDRIDKTIAPTSDFIAQAVGMGFGEKSKYGDYTPAQVAEVNKVLLANENQKRVSGRPITNNVLKQPSNIVDFRKTINEIIKKPKEAMDAADSAIELADDALKTNNFAAVAGLSSKLAKAMGDNDISNRDVARFGGDASLVGSVSDTLTTLATGTPTKDTIRKLRAVARIVSLKNKELIASEETAQRGLAKASGDYTDAQLDELFKLRPTAKGVTSGQTKSGTKYTVEESK